MLSQTLIFLITSIGGLFALVLLLRFMLQLLRAPARNQLSEFVNAFTDFAVRPARRVVPGWWGLDLASLILAWLAEVAQIWLVLKIKGYELDAAIGMALAAIAAIAIAKLAIYVVMVTVVLQAVLSWVNPYSPLAPLLTSMTRPFLRPFQKSIPLVANVDLSPLAVLLACQLLLTVPLVWLEAAVSRVL